MAETGDKLSSLDLDPEQLKVYREHFDVFDINGDGGISSREFRKVATKLGYRLTEDQIQVSVKQRRTSKGPDTPPRSDFPSGNDLERSDRIGAVRLRLNVLICFCA